MEKQKVIEWMLANIPAFPESIWQFINIPFDAWEWVHFGTCVAAINTETGECITRDDFYDARYEARLNPCGMTFKMMLEDLKL